MTDRGKVVKGLECCASISAGIKTCGYIPTQNDCPYSYLIEEDWNGCDSHVECTNALAADALKLLKEQEPRELTKEGKSITKWAAIGMKAPRWISVKDKLPTSVANKVLVWLEHEDLNGYLGFGHYEKYKGQEIWYDLEHNEAFSIRGYAVTHWMPLPEPPKEEE